MFGNKGEGLLQACISSITIYIYLKRKNVSTPQAVNSTIDANLLSADITSFRLSIFIQIKYLRHYNL